jgi:hypothetical protein
MHLIHVISSAEEWARIQQTGLIQRQSLSCSWKSSTDPDYFRQWIKKDEFDNVNLLEGVYFKMCPVIVKRPNEIVLSMHWSLLDAFKWHFNTTENHGFYIRDGVSVFSDEEGMTLFRLEDVVNFYQTHNDSVEDGELVLSNTDVPLTFVKQIV